MAHVGCGAAPAPGSIDDAAGDAAAEAAARQGDATADAVVIVVAAEAGATDGSTADGAVVDAASPDARPSETGSAGDDASADIDASAAETGVGTPDASAIDAGCPGLVCSGVCVADDDVHHCGSCDSDCTALSHVSGPVSCTAGQCAFPLSSCAPGWTHCSSNAAQGCETDESSASTCGGCGNACGASAPKCSGSGNAYQCVTGCPSTAPALCGGTCVDTTSSPANCGACGNACPAVAHGQPTCAGGVCGAACNSGLALCAGTCVDTSGDVSNCGGCGLHCASGELCVSGACSGPAGTNLCGGACAADSPAACGPSCAVCPAPTGGTATCAGSTCGQACSQAGDSVCGGACVDEST
ncbi:MAG: hypothetical protein ABSE49_34530, partial [Polyangiaceae bacterium]